MHKMKHTATKATKLLPALILAAASVVNASAAPLYLGLFDGNDDVTSVKSAILSATGSNVDVTLYDKSDGAPALTAFTPNLLDGNLSGTWDVLDNSIAISYLSVKASDRFTLYAYNPAVNFGDWSTANILNKPGTQPQLSHLSLWLASSTETQAPVPEPSTVMLLGGGILGILSWSRLRNKPGLDRAV
jgi:hypothetical protein